MSSAPPATEAAAPPSTRKWWTLAAVTFSLFMIMLDNTVVAVALPAIQRGLNASLSELEWVNAAYSLTFAVLLMPGGKLADLLGRRKIFLAGLVVFTLSSLWCGLATSGEMLIAARATQGFGAALMLPATISILTETFSLSERGLAFGIWSAVSGAGLAIGPLVGGLLVEWVHWSWIFFINVPIGIVGFVSTVILVNESRDESAERRLDVLGLCTSGAAIFLLTFGFIEANKHGWSSPLIVGCFAGAAALLVLFVLVERPQRAPLIDLALFREPSFVGANTVGLIVMCALFGFIFFISLYLQLVRGFSPIQAGATFLSSTLAMSAASPIAGKISDRIGSRTPIAVGLALFGAGLLATSFFIDAETSIPLLCAIFAVGGAGIGLMLTPATTTVVSSVPVDKSGIASGLMQAMRQLGGALGIAITGAIMAGSTGALTPQSPAYARAFVDGLQNVMLFGGLVAIGGALLSLVLVRGGAVHAESHAVGAAH